jgi:hypothetical protein
MDRIEVRRRWKDATLDQRFEMVHGAASSAAPEPPSVSIPIKAAAAPVLDDEETAHARRWAEAMLTLERAMAAEKEAAGKTQHDARDEFRKTSAIGQLLEVTP